MDSIVYCWLKNNSDWYYPTKIYDLYLHDHVELLSLHDNGDLFYAWDGDDKSNGRLFKGKWKSS